jgi:hypothetical protein
MSFTHTARSGSPEWRVRIIDPFVAKIEEWVERSDSSICDDRGLATSASRHLANGHSADEQHHLRQVMLSKGHDAVRRPNAVNRSRFTAGR